MTRVRRTALLALLAPAAASGQQGVPGTLTVSLDTKLVPALESVALVSDVRIWSGLSVAAMARRVGGTRSCVESSPSPCSPAGLGLGLGVRLTIDSSGSWSPYAEALAGRHQYSDLEDWKSFFDVGVGVGRSFGSRGLLRVGFQYGKIPANPPEIPEWRRPGVEYEHEVVGFFVGVGLRVR